MKEVKAYCRPEMVERVVRSLHDAGVGPITIVHVRSLREDPGSGQVRVSIEAGMHYIEHAKLELVCSEADVEDVVSLIRDAARTGSPGDGLVFVSPVERATKIRTGAEGRDALA